MNLEDVLPRFFEEPGGHVVLDQDLRVVEAGPEYLRLTRSQRENVVGKLFVNTITEPNLQRHTRNTEEFTQAAATVLKTKATAKLAPMRSDIVTVPNGKDTEERWWRIALVPVLDENDRVVYIVGRFEDISSGLVLQRKLRNQRISNYVLYAAALLAVGIIGWALQADNNRIATVDTKTCQVQTQYLKSTKPLNRVMKDFAVLLAAPRVKGQPTSPPRVLAAIARSRIDLAVYLSITNGLPAQRKCQ